jgi:hypothetical protein
MSPLVFTPPSVSAGVSSGLVLSDGQTDLDLLGSPPWGLYLVEFTLPVVSRENTYIPGPEGQRRIRSRPQNAVGSARVRIDRQDDLAAAYQADLHALQEMVESAHKRKGTLTFEPPNGQVVIYDIESCQITEAPADGPRMTQRIQEFVIEFECQPYGRLETETLFEDEVFDGPIDSVEIQVVNGHVDALPELTITDTSSEISDFVEFGVGQQGYDPEAPLRIQEDDWIISGAFAGTQPGGAGTQIETALTDEAISCCGIDDQEHGGRQKISVLLGTEDDDVWVRLAWKIDEGSFSYGRWVEVLPDPTDLRELTLAVIDMGTSTHWEAEVQAFQGDGSGTLVVQEAYIIPAEVCGRARATDDYVLAADKAMKFTHEGAFRMGTHAATLFARTPLDGDTLRIPVSTAAGLPVLLVVRRRTNDIDSNLSSLGRSDAATATLTVTPRVPLL